MSGPSLADLAAAKALLGIVIDADELDRAAARALGVDVPTHRVPPGYVKLSPNRWEVPGSSYAETAIVYVVERRPDTVNGGDYFFCNCPVWKYRVSKGETCKHVERVLCVEQWGSM